MSVESDSDNETAFTAGQLGGENRDEHEESMRESAYIELSKLFYPLYIRFIEPREEFVKSVELSLIQADRQEVVDTFLSARLGIGFIIGVLLSAVTAIGTVSYGVTNEVFPVLPDMLGSISPVLSWSATFIVLAVLILTILVGGTALTVIVTLYVSHRVIRSTVDDRATEIDVLLKDVIAFMYCQSVGGMSRLAIIRDVADSEETYGEVSTEFSRIVHYMDTFSEDPHKAIGRVAGNTASDDLAEFLNDMQSTITSGGTMETFLESQLETAISEVEQAQESELNDLEVYLQVYLALALLPVIGMVTLGFAAGIGFVGVALLIFVAYFFVPAIQLFAIGITITVFTDEYGSGILTPDESDGFEMLSDDSSRFTSGGVVEQYKDEGRVFNQIYVNELKLRLVRFLSNPLRYIKQRPQYVFIISIPMALITLIFAFATGNIPLTITGWVENSYEATIATIYLPIMVLLTPYAVFYEMKQRSLGKITDGLTNDLNKLANANEKGLTFRESIFHVSRSGTSRLSTEFSRIYKKQEYGAPLGQALIEVNNKYKTPRLARVFRIIKSAQEVSTSITEVLKTAADLSAAQDDIERERVKKTQQQMTIIIIIFLLFISIIVMMDQLLLSIVTTDTIAGSGLIDGVNPVPKETITLLSYHGGVMYALTGGILVGFIQTDKLSPGVKYSLGMLTLLVAVWSGVVFVL